MNLGLSESARFLLADNQATVIAANSPTNKPDTITAAGLGNVAERETVQSYFSAALFAAQYAFNLADNFALVARLTFFFTAFFTASALRATGFACRKLAHLAFCVAAIFFRTEALMVRFFFGAAPDLAGAPKIERSSVFKRSICSLIEAARLSWLMVRS